MAQRPNVSGVVDFDVHTCFLDECNKRGLKPSAGVNEVLKEYFRMKKGEVKLELTQPIKDDTTKTNNDVPKVNLLENVVDVDKLQSKKETKKEVKPEVIIPEIKYEVNTMAEEKDNLSERAKYNMFREEEKFKEAIADIKEKTKKLDEVCVGLDCIKKDNELFKKKFEQLESESKKVDICPECGEEALVVSKLKCASCGKQFKKKEE